MSWEVMYSRDYPCKCGKGTYTEVGEMDDWNRTRDYQVVNCPECAEKAKIAAEEKRKAEAAKKARLELLVDEITSHFEKHYMEEWISYFASARNKKQVWTLAKETGVEICSLSTFYDHNKGLSMDDYIRKLARPYKMLKIIEALNINDSHLKDSVEEAMDLKKSVYAIGFY